MHGYGLNRRDAGDTDCVGCASNGRATAIYNIKERAYHSLRRGKKAAARRAGKKRERRGRQARHGLK